MLHQAETAHLMLIDVQERLFPVIHDGEAMCANALRLVRGAAILGVPVTVSEQYVKGLGATLAPLRAVAPDAPRFEKMHFSAARNDAIRDHVARLAINGRDHLVLAGIEAHVCVLQTALDFIAQGHNVTVVADAVASRTPANHRLALDRLARAGAHVASTEMVLFEWTRVAGTERFRAISKLIK
ncbi:MAG: hydrolase [Pseudomonadota bacterium]